MKFISDAKWLSLITETYLEGLDAHTRDGSWCGRRLTLLRLAAKLSHVGADVDGLAYRLH
jgi:hypothetical protein